MTPAAGRVCPAPGCPTVITDGHTRCPAHRAEHERARGTRQARGYGATHQSIRTSIALALPTGTVRCVTCGAVLDETFDLGHNDNRTGYVGPQCRPCNRGDGGRRAGHDPSTR